MLTVYHAVGGALIKRGEPAAMKDAVWLDLVNPTKDEDLLVERDVVDLGPHA